MNEPATILTAAVTRITPCVIAVSVLATAAMTMTSLPLG